MTLKEYIKENILYLDGATGSVLQQTALKAGEFPELLNITRREDIIGLHKGYFDAGSNVVCANTFGANSLKFSQSQLEKVIAAAMTNADDARRLSSGPQPKWIALDIGPLGRMLKPYGDMDFETAVDIFARTVKAGAANGAELVFIETMSDSYETKAALIAAKENCSLPVFVCNAFGENGKLMTGADAAAMVFMLEGLGADAIGLNCSFGPDQLRGTAEKYIEYSSLPVIFKPNAGLPRIENGNTVYDLNARDFAEKTAELVKKGVRICGGCCGTTDEYIRELVRRTSSVKPLPVTEKNFTAVSSSTHAVFFGSSPVLIGERINPTGKKKLKEALKAGDIDYVLKEGVSQQEKGAHILDVNAGLPEIDEKKVLKTLVSELQAVTDLPLQIDTSDPIAMEAALRSYNGKAMINSVNGKKESMDAVFPLVKKYGGLTVCLTLDENGIPQTAEGRLAVAEKIIAAAKNYGISAKDLIFDPLALTVSADKDAAKETLAAIRLITEKLGAKTSLGVSNVSFGLPQRDVVNAAFFTLALGCGLSAAIMNPYSAEMMKAYRTFLALTGLDENFGEYIKFAENYHATEAFNVVSSSENPKQEGAADGEIFKSALQNAVEKGLKESAAAAARELLKEKAALAVIADDIVPALDVVGKGYEEKKIYLPQLLMSAEAAKAAFGEIKALMGGRRQADKCAFVIATVKGDIHDIGKNIVRLMLENYGIDVTDLGKDVAPEVIAERAAAFNAPIVGLSALMTTTVPAMEQTIKLLRQKVPQCKIVVGGAVLNEECAKRIGADKYAKDAMETVRYAESVNASLN